MDQSQNEIPNKEASRLYIFICICNILINIDHGILPAATNEMMADLNLTAVELGSLGSSVYFGLVTGSLIAGYIFQKYKQKNVLVVTLVLVMFFLSVYTFSTDKVALGLSRIGCGFFQVFPCVYFPVWVDKYGKSKKTIWLAILQIGVPLGVFLGYGITGVVTTYTTWKWAFWIQIILTIPFSFVFLLFNNKYLETVQNNQSKNKDNIETQTEQTDSQQKLERKSTLNSNGSSLQLGYFQQMCLLFKNQIYITTMVAMSSLYFIVTGIQFWISDYFRNYLEQEKATVFLVYASISITGPTLGVIFGGFLIQKQGGYSSPNALKICMIFGMIAFVTAAPIPFIKIFPIVAILIWNLLFFGGALMPPLTGIMINSVQSSMRTFASSNAQTYQNLLGFLPAPFLYGLVQDYTGGIHSNGGMILLMYWSFIGFFLLSIAYYSDIKIRQQQQCQNLQNIDTEQSERQSSEIRKLQSEVNQKEIKILISNENSIRNSYETEESKKQFVGQRISCMFKPGFDFVINPKKSIMILSSEQIPEVNNYDENKA